MLAKVVTIDCHYCAPQIAAAYLLINHERAVFIDNNTKFAVPRLLQTLQDQGLTPAAVDYAVITHVHLDHSGGSAALMEACPNAQLLCHPRAARHIIDPARLAAGTREVYGTESFDALYGEIDPVPGERVRSMEDGEEIEWAGRPLQFYHTPGHASHHMVITDRETSSLFTGDAFGICYPGLQRNGQLVLAACPPTDFDAELSRQSAYLIDKLNCAHIYPTHFGKLPGTRQEALKSLCDDYDFYGDLVNSMTTALQEGHPAATIEKQCHEAVKEYLYGRIHEKGLTITKDEEQLLGLELNAMGTAFAAQRKYRKLNKNKP